TRSQYEVQQSNPVEFEDRLGAVWKECHRVLRKDGLLIFTYHHSRSEGWRCVLHALGRSDFVIVAVHPIKAEMSVAMPKNRAKEPIDYDIIVVCRKRTTNDRRLSLGFGSILEEATEDATTQIA